MRLPAHPTGEGWRTMEIICLHEWIAPVIQERDSLKAEVVSLCNTVDDLVTLVNRMRQRLHIVAPLDKTSAQALDYLNRKNLQG